ncbi:MULTISPECIES: GNAT family N-acetyltransferase [unclassified Amycolatopsis]|uniref:GNAT family N-acetyltransferase n=1 Tax=unclassified Amycolatopsis TaxID=2618356 RepID=UPI00287411FC|nr:MULTISPECIES: GNAT family N-acetyltransferase [unclassified Amycolatopsis]MDS0140567.1 GNAT family N-acetyltransferase [Amycolatopsis sp. 505]MDS0149217.1 GNAT family N-acetyltransferase [Amycolatopsis sp. CM201R]
MPVENLRGVDTDEVAAVIAAAFIDLEIAEFLVPHDIAERERCLREQFAYLARAALISGGRVQGIRECGRVIAAAVWTIHPGGEITEPDDYDTVLRSITGPHYERFRALDDTFNRTTPQDPHHHLHLLAASRRRTGFGTRLLTEHLTWADNESGGTSTHFLHASNPTSARLYHRHDFQPADFAEIPGSNGVYVYPMRRHPPADISSHSRGGVHVV